MITLFMYSVINRIEGEFNNEIIRPIKQNEILDKVKELQDKRGNIFDKINKILKKQIKLSLLKNSNLFN